MSCHWIAECRRLFQMKDERDDSLRRHDCVLHDFWYYDYRQETTMLVSHVCVFTLFVSKSFMAWTPATKRQYKIKKTNDYKFLVPVVELLEVLCSNIVQYTLTEIVTRLQSSSSLSTKALAWSIQKQGPTALKIKDVSSCCVLLLTGAVVLFPVRSTLAVSIRLNIWKLSFCFDCFHKILDSLCSWRR